MNFSPRKLRTSMRVTPLNMFLMWLQTVLTAAICFFLPNHFSTLMVLASVIDVDCKMLELLGEGAPLALHRDGSSLDRCLDALRHFDQLKGIDFLHDFSCRSESSNKSLVVLDTPLA